jgi:hypothetical protein
VFGDADRAARLRDDEAFSGFDLHRTQMLDDLFGRVPLLGQVNDLPGCRSRLRFCLNQICPGRSHSLSQALCFVQTPFRIRPHSHQNYCERSLIEPLGFS